MRIVMTYTVPNSTSIDLAAIAACREARWPTAEEMDHGEKAETQAVSEAARMGPRAHGKEADPQGRLAILG